MNQAAKEEAYKDSNKRRKLRGRQYSTILNENS